MIPKEKPTPKRQSYPAIECKSTTPDTSSILNNPRATVPRNMVPPYVTAVTCSPPSPPLHTLSVPSHLLPDRLRRLGNNLD